MAFSPFCFILTSILLCCVVSPSISHSNKWKLGSASLLAWYCRCSGVGHCNKYGGPYFNLHCLDDMAHLFTCCFPDKMSLMEHAFGNVSKTHYLIQKSWNTQGLSCALAVLYFTVSTSLQPVLRCGCGCLLVLTALTEKAVLVVLISSHFIFCGFWRNLFSIIMICCQLFHQHHTPVSFVASQ